VEAKVADDVGKEGVGDLLLEGVGEEDELDADGCQRRRKLLIEGKIVPDVGRDEPWLAPDLSRRLHLLNAREAAGISGGVMRSIRLQVVRVLLGHILAGVLVVCRDDLGRLGSYLGLSCLSYGERMGMKREKSG
jgi:hypothetical protein